MYYLFILVSRKHNFSIHILFLFFLSFFFYIYICQRETGHTQILIEILDSRLFRFLSHVLNLKVKRKHIFECFLNRILIVSSHFFFFFNFTLYTYYYIHITNNTYIIEIF